MSGKTDLQKKPGRFRFIDLLVIIVFVFIAAVCVELFRRDLMQTFSLQNIEPVGTVVVKRNTVQRRLGDRIVWDRLAHESPVYVWDIIRVADISAATLYIQDNSIDLGENTLIRIVPSANGEGITIVLDSGNLFLVAGDESNGLIIDINGQHLIPVPGNILSAVVTEQGQTSFREYETVDQLIQSNISREIPGPRLFSPAVNSVFRYHDDKPVVNFRWERIEEAVSYVLEVSSAPDFSSLHLRRMSSIPSLSNIGLENGLWFWRVIPVFPSVLNSNTDYSTVSFFSIEQTDMEIGQDTNLSQWLAAEAPPMEIPQGVPAEFIPAAFIVEVPPEPDPPPLPAPLPAPPPAPLPPPPPVLLTAPQNIRPASGTSFGYAQLLSQRSITFNWATVQGANAYIFSLYHQTSTGRHQIVRSTINRGTSYVLDNLTLLDRGTFIWQVEPVNIVRGNVDRRGRVSEGRFVIDYPSPGPVHIEDTGTLYGN
ncbi:MAG: hypothetical protein FWD13_06875 [Treponema sp.]|nr:hypothetical protein [Treponema sp.]